MNSYENETASFHCEEDVHSFVENVISVVEDHPVILQPHRGIHEYLEKELSKKHIIQYPTTRRTTLFHDSETDCFLKILHQRNSKSMIKNYLSNSARNLYSLSEYLLNNNVKITRVKAYGTFRKGRTPFYVIGRAKGASLYDLLIRNGKTLPMEAYFSVIEEVVKIHKLGYWLGDAHLSDFFIQNNTVSSLIDFNNIRKNLYFRKKHFAKDLAGLNHPKVNITKEEKRLLIDYYLNMVKINNRNKFIDQLKQQTELRWKG